MSSVSQSLPQPKYGVPRNRRQGVNVLAGATLCLISEDRAEDVLVVWSGFDNGGTWDEGAPYRPRASG